MTAAHFRERLAARLDRVGLVLMDEVATALETYFRLLERWNAKINLTALPLADATDDTMDRLFVEPLLAARYVVDRPITWFDLGTGGGSPAIPLKIVRPRARLVMVESKARKTAFLREAVRVLELSGVHVETARIEEIAPEAPGTAQLVTVRAVRLDEGLFDAAGQLLADEGRLLLFRSETAIFPVPDGFRVLDREISPKVDMGLAVLVRVPRGTI